MAAPTRPCTALAIRIRRAAAVRSAERVGELEAASGRADEPAKRGEGRTMMRSA